MEERADFMRFLGMPDKQLTPAQIEKNRSIVRYARAWMKKRSLTQARLAELMGVSPGLVSKWLNGTQTMNGQQLTDLANVLDTDLAGFLAPPGDDATAQRVAKILRIARMADDSDLVAIEALLSRRSPTPE